MSFDLTAARAFCLDNHSAFDELPEEAEELLRDALDEVVRLRDALAKAGVQAWT